MVDAIFLEIDGDETYYLGNLSELKDVREAACDYIRGHLDDDIKEREINLRLFCKEMTQESIDSICEGEDSDL